MVEVQQYIERGLEKLQNLEANAIPVLENLKNAGLTATNAAVEEVSKNVTDSAAWGRFAYFVMWILGLWAARVLVLNMLLKLSRGEYAENHRITKRPAISPAQLERESVWKYGYFYDTVVMIIIYWVGIFRDFSFFDWRAFFYMAFFHATVVEFVYYWFHRALHWPWLYKNFHSYHHKSINTEPTTALSFEIGERLSYTFLFAIAPALTHLVGCQSYVTFCLYFIWFDIMNEGGHINFEFVPDWLLRSPLRYVLYTPTFHAVHHTKFKRNFSLFMPWTDIVFGTATYSQDDSLPNKLPQVQQDAEPVDVMLLVHAGYVTSALYSYVLHPRIIQWTGYQKHLYEHKFWMFFFYPYLLWGLISWSVFHTLGYLYEEVFSVLCSEEKDKPHHDKEQTVQSVSYALMPAVEADHNQVVINVDSSKLPHVPASTAATFPNIKHNLKASTWIVLNFGFQYLVPWFQNILNTRIERAVLDAHSRGVRVVGLGNFNKAEWLNKGGADIVEHLGDRIKGTYVTHGDTLCGAVIVQHCLNLRRQGYWNQGVYVTGATSKIGRAICLSLASKGVTVKMLTQCKARFDEIAAEAKTELQRSCLHYCDKLSQGADCDLWLTGKMIPYGKELLDGIPLNTTVLNFSVPDPLTPALLEKRRDILHLDTSLLAYNKALMSPNFTWLLPEGLIYACLGGAIVHAALRIEDHEVGPVNVDDMEVFWEAAQSLGFKLPTPTPTSFYKATTLPPPRKLTL